MLHLASRVPLTVFFFFPGLRPSRLWCEALLAGDRSKGREHPRCFPCVLEGGEQGSWGCLQHPFFTSPGSPPSPRLAQGLIHQAEFLMQSLGREPAHHRALV